MYNILLPLLQPGPSEWSYEAILCTFGLHVFAYAVPNISNAFSIPQSKSCLFLDIAQALILCKTLPDFSRPHFLSYLPPFFHPFFLSFLYVHMYVCLSLRSFWTYSLFCHILWFYDAKVLWCIVTLCGMVLLV